MKTLPAGVRSQYDAFDYPIEKSAFATWTPKTKQSIKIGVSTIEPANSYAQLLNSALSSATLKQEIPNVGKVIALTYPLSASGLSTQIQQVDQMIQQHVDYLLVEADSPQAFVPIAKRAYEAGIPFISLLNVVPSPYAINLGTNLDGGAINTGDWLAKQIGGKGLVLGVHGITATSTDADPFKGWTTAFGECSGITFNTTPVGDFQAPVAKSAVLSFLSTNPQPVAGVVEAGGMASGIIDAFQQTGRKVPPMVIVGPTLGDLAYWTQNKAVFKAYGNSYLPAPALGKAGALAVSLMQSGADPKVNMIMSLPPVINTQNLSQWAKPGASLDDPTDATGPGNWLDAGYLKHFFK